MDSRKSNLLLETPPRLYLLLQIMFEHPQTERLKLYSLKFMKFKDEAEEPFCFLYVLSALD